MYVARALPEYTRASGWVDLLPPRRPQDALSGHVTADVAVIGAGFAGLAAARTLQDQDPALRIVLLEASEIALGAAGRNSGFVIDLPHEVSSEDYAGGQASDTRRQIHLNRSAIALIARIAAENGCGSDVFDPCGKYNIAMGSKGDHHITAYARQLDALGEPYRLLDAKAIAEVTGTDRFSSAIHMPGTAIIQPAAWVRLAADSLGPGVRLHERTPVTAFARQGGAWQLTTPAGRITAPRVILATNGHAQSFGLYAGQLLHVFTYASMSEPFAPARLGGHRSWAATPAFPMGTTVRRVQGTDGDRLLIRSRYTYHARPKIGEADVARAGRVHDRKFAARFPMLLGLRMAHRWGGAMALTWNGVPTVGEIEPGLFSACTCNGVGATKATAAGIAAAQQALGLDTELVDTFRRAAPPRALPPQPWLTLGARLNLRWREWRAGIE
ncbi:MAG: hypothetical protein RL223_795 [Pseudomonadota bacterium]|jgi:glycine/D-amino acid oxidase-like deaminating enzyme